MTTADQQSVASLRAVGGVAERPDSDEVAGLIGQRWLRYLDSRWQRDEFTGGAGRLLLAAPYARPDTIERQHAIELAALCADWLKAQRPRRRAAYARGARGGEALRTRVRGRRSLDHVDARVALGADRVAAAVAHPQARARRRARARVRAQGALGGGVRRPRGLERHRACARNGGSRCSARCGFSRCSRRRGRSTSAKRWRCR